ncbi:CD1871A family CXXC motif-containing protein [Desulfocapsa sulfexigens]|uniref:CD1871A family CXXC motif-containing protein n=1 Tax=Desulfocapsa sulfexigens TaxID=65555 RepID=UPI000349F792|nr:CD1871A family CXXC motif-containing protein [Desulfocapsa sulfexigens]
MKKKNQSPPVKIRKAPFITIFVFLVLGAVGISLGEPSRVLEQATRICLSCIGIG